MGRKRRSSRQLRAVARLRGRPAPVKASSRSSGGGVSSDPVRMEEEAKIAELRGIKPEPAPLPPGTKKQVIVGIGKETKGGYFGAQLGKQYSQEQRKVLAEGIRKAQLGSMQTVTATTETPLGQTIVKPDQKDIISPVTKQQEQTVVTITPPDQRQDSKLKQFFQYENIEGQFQLSDLFRIDPLGLEKKDARFARATETMRSSLYLRGVKAEKGGVATRMALEEVFSNPYTTALAITGVAGVAGRAAGVFKAGGKLRFLTQTIPTVAASGAVGYQTTKFAITGIQQTPEIRGVSKKYPEEITTSIKKGFREREKYLEGQPWYKQLAGEVPGLSMFVGKGKYEEGVRRSLRQQGVPQTDVEAAIKASKAYGFYGTGAGEVGGFIASSTATERIGRQLFIEKAKTGLPKFIGKAPSFGKKFLYSAKVVAPLGFAEAATQEVITQTARREQPDFLKVAGAGAFGTVSAGVLGGVIGGLTPYPKGPGIKVPAIKKAPRTAVEALVYISDPYEGIGDVLATGIGKAGAKITGKPVLKAGVQTFTVTPDVIVNTFQKGGQKINLPIVDVTGKGKGVKTTPAPYAPSVKTLEPIVVYEPAVFSETPTPGKKKKGPITPSGITSPIEIPTDTEIPVDIPVDIPTDTPTGDNGTGTPSDVITDIITETQTPTSIFTFTGTPTFTPILRYAPPFLPPGLGGLGGGMGATRGKRRSKYVDEVAAAGAAFRGLVGSDFGQMTDFIKKQKPKKKGKKKKKKKGKKLMRKKISTDPLDLLGNLNLPKIF